MSYIDEVTRALASSGKKKIKRLVLDVIEASCSEKEFKQFVEFLEERDIKVVSGSKNG
jgi:ribosomal protein S3AE